MTSKRAFRLAGKLAKTVLAGGPHSPEVLETRIVNQVAELLLTEFYERPPRLGDQSTLFPLPAASSRKGRER